MRHFALTIVSPVLCVQILSSAHATDYFHECRTADGLYQIDDGILFSTKEVKRTSIPYKTIHETILSEKIGYCIAKDKHFGFEDKTYVVKIKFQAHGYPVETDALCEKVANGLPAAFKCDREVVTRDFKAGSSKVSPAKSGSPTVWDHNGSIMRLEASGSDRKFVYDIPRRGMVKAGVTAGDAVFEGRREG
jgi:hypothetical protein